MKIPAETESNEKITPMLQQYLEVKSQYERYVLFYRLGDFYEMFFEDAVNISKELELTLTSRAGVPMCGIPYHSAEGYIRRLIQNGHRVAICEQTEDPAQAKGLVNRSVVRIVTPGTVIEDGMLEEDKNNYISSVYYKDYACGLVFADVSTGEFHIVEKRGKDLTSEIIGELSRYNPSELLFNEDFLEAKEVHNFIRIRLMGCLGDVLDDCKYSLKNEKALKEQYLSENDNILNQLTETGKKALFALFDYINDTYKSEISRSVKFYIRSSDEYMELNLTTRRNLELLETMRAKERKGSLIWVLDKTKTSMGKRRLKQYVTQPLLDITKILARLDAVEKLSLDIVLLGDLSDNLSGIYDLERLMSRIIYKIASPRDVYALGKACEKLPQLKQALSKFEAELLIRLNDKINPLTELFNLINNAISEEPPANTKDGGYIKSGFNKELDRLREITSGGKDILKAIEEKEREATGIKNLRIGYNHVFGYYIEVSKGNVDLVPGHYIRRQTLSSGERYITEELKNIERDILSANDKILKLEAQIFSEIRDFISEQLEKVQETADAIADVDVLTGFANVSIENNYVRPDLSLESVIEIRDGRHPVIEKIRTDTFFTSNDTFLDIKENRLIIITGPNMSGKSTYMRQVALITLMAQIGCFVPARYARIGVVDKIFTRVGASDDLSAGQSTFMVEMNEVAEILNSATRKSLVILDEIGRGTSTFDGISIAKAVAEYINSKAIGCKTLFATHYHELITLEKSNKGIKNFSVAVIKKGDEIQFLHKIVDGGTDDSYGIEVAKLAGLPSKVINAAKQALSSMEINSKITLENELALEESEKIQVDFKTIATQNLVQRLKNLDMDNLTPKDAYLILDDFKNSIK